MTVRKCKHCGADVVGEICSYCRCRVNTGEKWQGSLLIDGEDVPVYIEEMSIDYTDIDSIRDMSGRVYRQVSKPKRTFTVVEY